MYLILKRRIYSFSISLPLNMIITLTLLTMNLLLCQNITNWLENQISQYFDLIKNTTGYSPKHYYRITKIYVWEEEKNTFFFFWENIKHKQVLRFVLMSGNDDWEFNAQIIYRLRKKKDYSEILKLPLYLYHYGQLLGSMVLRKELHKIEQKSSVSPRETFIS